MNISPRFFLGVDQGTSGTTALITDASFNQVSLGYRSHGFSSPASGVVEQDGEKLFGCACEAIQESIDKACITSNQICCVGIANQGESVIAWDRITGEPVSQVIGWQDKRTSTEIDSLKSNIKNKIHAITGLVPDAYFSASKLQWILRNIPNAARKAKEGSLCLGTLDTFLIFRFTNGKVFATDHSTASRTMLYNLETKDWDEWLLSLFEIPRACLPEIRSTAGDFGSIDRTFFGSSLPITGSAVDQQCALFGHGCFSKGEVKTTYGTGCFMLLNTGSEAFHTKSGLLTTVGWNFPGKSAYALDGSVYAAGSIINWMKREMSLISSAFETEKLAKSVKNTDGVYFVPAFSGLGAPYWDQDVRGTILGMTFSTRKEHVIRAALESIAYQVADILQLMEHEMGSTISVMKADGGLTANGFLMQFQADMIGIPIEIPKIREATALGAIRLAAIGSGFVTGTEEFIGGMKIEARYEPMIGENVRQQMLNKWHDAVSFARKKHNNAFKEENDA